MLCELCTQLGMIGQPVATKTKGMKSSVRIQWLHNLVLFSNKGCNELQEKIKMLQRLQACNLHIKPNQGRFYSFMIIL